MLRAILVAAVLLPVALAAGMPVQAPVLPLTRAAPALVPRPHHAAAVLKSQIKAGGTTPLTAAKPGKQDLPPDLRTPADMVLLAAADAKKLGQAAYYVRYLDLSSIHPAEREEAYLVLTGHLQHLSRSSVIERPELVAGTGGTLLRIYPHDYGGAFAKSWEQLADVDPYYHVRLYELENYYWHGGKGDDGKYYPAGTYQRKGKAVSVGAPWLSPSPAHKAALLCLTEATGSYMPIARADWFFNQTAASQNRKPGYYDFLGVKKQADFEKIVGFDRKLFDGFSVELRASIAVSGVTLQPRGIARFGALGGGIWFSLDAKQALGGKNPLDANNLGRALDFDASEVFALLANGFWTTGVFLKDGTRQDVAAADIASDGASKSNDRQVHVNISCMRCHYEGGLKPLTDFVREALAPPPGLSLNSYDYEALRLLKQQYFKQLTPFLAKDRLVFEEAVKEATGWTAQQYLTRYAAFWEGYEDARVDIAFVERHLGIPRAKIRKAIAASVAYAQGDLLLAALLKDNTSFPIRQFEERIPTIYEALISYHGAK